MYPSAESVTAGTRQLLLFVHGFGGSRETWGGFPALIGSDAEMRSFDTEFYEYPAHRWQPPWKKTPTVQLLAEGLHTEIEDRFGSYESVVLVAHSLGGLVVRRYLADRVLEWADTSASASITDCRVRKVLLYAVPNNGAGLAKVGTFVSRRQPQLRQLCKNSDFLAELNNEWGRLHVGDRFDIKYVVAGQDSVVDVASAKGLQGVRQDIAVLANCNHRDCVKPKTVSDLSYRVLKNFVLQSNPPLPAPVTGGTAAPSCRGLRPGWNAAAWADFLVDSRMGAPEISERGLPLGDAELLDAQVDLRGMVYLGGREISGTRA